MLFQNLPIGRRVAVGFASVLSVFVLVGALGLFSNLRLAEADHWNEHTNQVLDRASDLLAAMVDMETGVRGFLASGDEPFLDPWKHGRQAFDAAWTEARSLTADNPKQQERLAGMRQRHDEFEAIANTYIALRRDVSAGKVTREALETRFRQAADKAAMDAFRGFQHDFAQAEQDVLASRYAVAEQTRTFNRNVILFGTLTSVLGAAGIGYWLSRSITRPIQSALKLAETVAAGDLSMRIDVETNDETGRLLTALQGMNASLSTIVRTVRASSDSIRTGTGEIASGNIDLSQRTEEQASNVQQTAASVEQLNGTVKNSADVARQATQLAVSASDAAVLGGEVVAQVVTTMHDIAESSKRIGVIIGVIDGIAFQTNILALNAAVEAARAGEQGRGFAVVASEVRSLAQRSAQAAREIKGLIGASEERVDSGNRLVGEAGKTMADIVGQVKRVADLIAEISAAAHEQTTGIGQINDAVAQLDTVTQQNAALVEESAAAAESLRVQAAGLVDAVAVFRL